MLPVEITKNIFWVGAKNPGLRIFDVIMRTDCGTSYNSYLVKGSKKTAVIDTVKLDFSEEQIERISGLSDVSSIDYIICNHTEPDHSGGLENLLAQAPNAVVVCSKPASVFLRNILNRNFECMVVEDGDTLELGGKTLKFISAPFLHWPDSILTYVIEDAVLFSGDVFGFHFSAENIFDDLTSFTEEMLKSQKYYFDVIMGPFKKYVLDAVKKVRTLHIDVIGPSHGPVLRGAPQDAIDRYEAWASDILSVNSPKKVYIGYVSCYGYTKSLAESIYQIVKDAGFDVEIEDIATVDASISAAKIHAADAFAIGSPTLNRDVMKPVWDVLTSISTYIVKGKIAAVFGSFGWSGESIKYISERLRGVGADVIGSCSAKLRPDEKETAEAEKLGKTICDALAE
ncbi:MAG: FprA family A-type flavoprotein [Christensenellales bacterium]|jgi:flavorubredoxin